MPPSVKTLVLATSVTIIFPVLFQMKLF
jgi:hypothetical protein